MVRETQESWCVIVTKASFGWTFHSNSLSLMHWPHMKQWSFPWLYNKFYESHLRCTKDNEHHTDRWEGHSLTIPVLSLRILVVVMWITGYHTVLIWVSNDYVSAHQSNAQPLVSCHNKSLPSSDAREAEQVEMQLLHTTLHRHYIKPRCVIDSSLFSCSPELRRTCEHQCCMSLITPPQPIPGAIWLCRNVKLNELAWACYVPFSVIFVPIMLWPPCSSIAHLHLSIYPPLPLYLHSHHPNPRGSLEGRGHLLVYRFN